MSPNRSATPSRDSHPAESHAKIRRMTTAAPTAPAGAKVNLRRPDIMEAVQAQVLSHYRSELVELIRKNGHTIGAPGVLTVRLAKEFGFCYGVERAIDLAYAARKAFPDRRIFLLGEIIHNPEVNDQIQRLGILTIASRPTDEQIAEVGGKDIVIIPAFGTEVATRQKLEARGCTFVDTTCGDVMSVWRRVRQYSKESVTSIIHGKAWHEETLATSSQARANGSGHYLVVFSLSETDYVCDYIVRGGDKEAFLEKFKGAYSAGFDPDLHLEAIGVANQTTMLRGETEEVQRRLRAAMAARFGTEALPQHFRFFDTICGATQERQDALEKMLQTPPNLLIVIGGYNSSNTSHLAEMGEAVLPTFFVKNAGKMESPALIRHWDQHRREEVETRDWLPSGEVIVGVTAGASCPNSLIEEVIERLFELKGVPLPALGVS
jgi:4-hydroxy-3-methylbut-2-enyl diphosphate reductase